ncbi:hypothetical protein [Chryseobacterium oryctis]|uniref:Outer membrane protein beta-barrel domain-containing protein n=1 Tax=Chryseobacterium oryctis TaxID=2952618 RepID=A0ABT3HJR2_9FLAO|nr:hypothetical protein [Chryseobacterium oryctis]MCW3159913.1 hypothetical protein [Chryseobacterium oryctis]
MKNLILCCTVLFCSLFKAQIGRDKEWESAILILSTRIECTSFDNKGFLSIGMKIPSENGKNYYSLRGHFNWWDLPERKFIVIPELDYFHKIKSFEGQKAVIRSLYLGAGITPNAVSPKFGINFYYFFTAELGYNYEFTPYKHFSTKGFRYSWGINLVF